jgi:hypothetical protein
VVRTDGLVAAWINRREKHLAVNAIVYGFAVAWE